MHSFLSIITIIIAFFGVVLFLTLKEKRGGGYINIDFDKKYSSKLIPYSILLTIFLLLLPTSPFLFYMLKNITQLMSRIK